MLKKLFILSFLSFANIYALGVGKVSVIKGNAFVSRGSSDLVAKVLMGIENKDIVKTQNKTKIQLSFNDDTVVTLGANTNFEVEDYLLEEKNSKINMSVQSGSFKVISGKIGKLAPKNFLLETKASLIGIRGTIFAGKVSSQGEYVGCIKGTIVVYLKLTGKSVVLKEGEMIFIDKKSQISDVKEIKADIFAALNHLQEQNKISALNGTKEINEQKRIDKLAYHSKVEEEKRNRKIEEERSFSLEEDLKSNSIQTLIDNNSIKEYSGKLNGTSKGEHKINSSITKLEANIDADMNMRVDFGGNDPLKVDILNQNIQITSASVDGVATSNPPISNLNSYLSIDMNQTINKDNLEINGTYENTNNGFTIKVNLDGEFKDKQASGITGTFNENTKGTLNGISMDRTINANFDVNGK